jgi:hypothetical protein
MTGTTQEGGSQVATASAVSAKPQAVAEIDRLGFGYTEIAQYDLTNVSPDRRVQVREVGHYAPKESVERYAVQMNHVEFPPIVMTKDQWIVDGNTRVGAKLYRKEKFFPAIVLDVTWEGAGQKRKDEVLALAATLNAQNGVPLTAKETRSAVRTFIALGWLNEQIARAIGVKASTVTAVRKEIEAEVKLEKVGLSVNGDMKGASLRALGVKDVLSLNDVPFKTLAELARDADLNAKEIVDIARSAKEAGSDSAAMARFAELRSEFRDRIQQKTLTGTGKPPMSRQVRQHLGLVLKYADHEDELLETDPGVAAKHIEALERAIGILTKVLAMQRGPSE